MAEWIIDLFNITDPKLVKDISEQVPYLLNNLGFAAWETIYSTVLATLFAYLIGLPLGVLLVAGAPDGVRPLPGPLMKALNVVINLLRSVPFLILMVVVFPLARGRGTVDIVAQDAVRNTLVGACNWSKPAMTAEDLAKLAQTLKKARLAPKHIFLFTATEFAPELLALAGDAGGPGMRTARDFCLSSCANEDNRWARDHRARGVAGTAQAAPAS